MKKLLLTFLSLQLFTFSAFALSLAWDANPASDQVTGYNVYEHVGSVYNLLATVGPTITTYALVNPTTGPHAYVVTAVNLRGESGYSNETVLPGLPGAPANLRITQ